MSPSNLTPQSEPDAGLLGAADRLPKTANQHPSFGLFGWMGHKYCPPTFRSQAKFSRVFLSEALGCSSGGFPRLSTRYYFKNKLGLFLTFRQLVEERQERKNVWYSRPYPRPYQWRSEFPVQSGRDVTWGFVLFAASRSGCVRYSDMCGWREDFPVQGKWHGWKGW